MRHLSTLLVLPLLACGSDVAVTQKALCDGQQQAGEDTVDSAFDRDGDGFFDKANPDCAATYPVEFLDCDDGDPTVNPGAVEVGCTGIDEDCDPSTADDQDADGDGVGACEDCDDNDADVAPGLTETTCDGLDNDCDPDTEDEPDSDGDGSSVCEDCDDDDDERSPDFEEECEDEIDNNCDDEVDEDCAIDRTGIWVLETPTSFVCAGGAVNINASTIAIEDYYPAIRATMGTSQPGLMTGNFTSETAFFVGRNIAGTCTEDYRLEAEFTGPDHLEGSLILTFTDTYGLGLCLDCVSTVLPVSATR